MNNNIPNYTPTDSSKQVDLAFYVEKIIVQEMNGRLISVLDLGCGKGESEVYFNSLGTKISWVGIDIENSPEVNSRATTSDRLKSFDGINIPFSDNYFDIIYCRQVLEHVRYPRELLFEVSRVLKSDGYFIGSTSHLEPFHSLSHWNFTPYGFNCLIEEVKLRTLEIRPGIDSLTLIIRRGLGSSRLFNVFFRKLSPLNLFLFIVGKIFRISNLTINTIRLLFCGQFIFIVKKD